MTKWRVERGVVQQTEALVRGFYEVNTGWTFWLCDKWHHQKNGFFWGWGWFSIIGGRLQAGVSVWCPRTGAGYRRYCGDWPGRLEEQYRVSRGYVCISINPSISLFFFFNCIFPLYAPFMAPLTRLPWRPHSDAVVLGRRGAFQQWAAPPPTPVCHGDVQCAIRRLRFLARI